jgi:hypothetical protein
MDSSVTAPPSKNESPPPYISFTTTFDIVQPSSFSAMDSSVTLASPSKNESPPPYISPTTTFAIGANRISVSLVNTDQLKGHLSLLEAFYALRTRAQAEADDFPPLSGKETPEEAGERRWARFVGFAVER